MTEGKHNQGEGNKKADRRYRENTRDFIDSGKVPDAAEKARDAVEGKEKGTLKDAEEKGRNKARH